MRKLIGWMVKRRLKDRRVTIEVSDPWDIAGEIGKPISGVIIDEGSFVNKYYDNNFECIFIKLDNPIKLNGAVYSHMSASPRYEGSSYLQIGKGMVHSNMNFLQLTDDLYSSWHMPSQYTSIGAIGSIN